MSALVLYCRMAEENILKELLHGMDWDSDLEEGEVVDQENPVNIKCPVGKCKDKSFAKPFSLQRHWAEIHCKQIKLRECLECLQMSKNIL